MAALDGECGVQSMNTSTLASRFEAKVLFAGPDACWEWAGAKSSGYGKLFTGKVGGKTRTAGAHRVSYELYVGPIPEGMVIDHLCRNRGCVNPAHLEPVTDAENIRRGLTGRMVTECPQGHSLCGDNLRSRPDGRRGCAECMRQHNNRRTGSCVDCSEPIMSRSTRCNQCGSRIAWEKRKAAA